MAVRLFMWTTLQLLCAGLLATARDGVGERMQTSVAPCTSGPLGMESGAIPDDSITASSFYHEDYRPSKARLNVEKVGWIPRKKAGQWIQVDLSEYTAITGVIVQGYRTMQHVKSFSVKYSDTAMKGEWKSLVDEEGQVLELAGNTGSGQPVTVTFPSVIVARYIRLLPLTWSRSAPYALRLEVLGCRDAIVRLVDGDVDWSGRVEIYRNGSWGVVCDQDWDLLDATTVCRQLGFKLGAREAKTGSFFGKSGSLPAMMARVSCKGTESRLADCPFVCKTPDKCGRTREAGVICRPNTIRLVGGSNATNGRVEVRRSDIWGTVCDNDWDLTDASIVCRQLGFSEAVEAKAGAYFGPGRGPVHLDGLACDGSESDISDCPSLCWEETQCNHTRDAGVICRSN
ncbi:scavenger receptor cysteine-rich domain superfamily protein-like [Patiria miniata]|uniref:Uncharacterized protein n=1 Tax=Patiria miniata TaxID=46514 RepID=A0A914AZQ2_PATMI|nr:scavenger receptor cysteine-rich domain superfamily protein-like [Patiria miniata]